MFERSVTEDNLLMAYRLNLLSHEMFVLLMQQHGFGLAGQASRSFPAAPSAALPAHQANAALVSRGSGAESAGKTLTRRDAVPTSV